MTTGQAERILDGAEELFLTAGIRSVTMDDIAKRLGMSKKTIYQFFADKNELVNALVRKRLKDDEEGMCRLKGQSADVIGEMITMMKYSEEFFSRASPVLIHDLQKYHPAAWKEFQNFKSGVIVQTMVELLTKGIAQGYIRPEIDVNIMARLRVSEVELGFSNTHFPAGEFNVWKVQQQLLEHFNYGICTLKGYQLLDEYRRKQDPLVADTDRNWQKPA